MQKFLMRAAFVAALGVVLGLTSAAHAADKYVPPVVDDVIDAKTAGSSPWTGLYISGGLGLKSSELDVANMITLGETAVAADVRVGYSVMFAPHWVASIFGQVGIDNANYKVAGFKLADSSISYMIGATLGIVPRSDWQIYGLVAYEWQDVEFNNGLKIPDVGGNSWVVGGGLEVALSDHLFLGAEGTVNLGASDDVCPGGCMIKVEASDYTGKLRIGYRF